MATINYADKVALDINPDIADINKVNASDMNLLKQVGNQTLKTIGVFTDDWSSSATYAVKDIVIYDNRVFENLTGTNTATTPDQDTTNWEETTIAAMAGGADIPIRPTAPSNPQEDDLWIDTSDYSLGYQDVYSTNEVKTNKIWIDGKPIYRKVFTGYTTTGNYNHNLSNIDNIWLDETGSKVIKTTGRVFPANYIGAGTLGEDYGSVSVNSTQILIGGNIANLSNIVVSLFYTKTTD